MKRPLPGHALAALVLFAAVGGACDAPKVQRPSAGGPASARADGGTSVSLVDAGAGAGGGGAGGLPGGPGTNRCAEDSFRGERIPLDLMLLVDTSGSMLDPAGNRSKWSMAHEALGSFVRDPGSAGLGVGLTLFPAPAPAKTCTNETDCGGINALPGLLCAARGACVGPTGDPAGAPACENLPLVQNCGPGLRCASLGRCSVSGAECVQGGAPCPGGVGDQCGPGPKYCRNTTLDPGCDAPAYAKPRVPIADLPAGAPALGMALDAVRPAGATPMGPAVTGVLEHLRAHVAARPERRVALVLATDGLPMGCTGDSVDAVASALQMARAASPAISTYVIGVFAPMSMPGASEMALGKLATAGGTGAPFVVEPGPNLNQKFLEALNQIRGAALACEFQIPRPQTGVQDFNKVNVRYTGAAGAEDLLYVGAADRCDPARGGWYYDIAPASGTPTRIIVCESTCRRFKADAGGSVEVRVGCATRVD